jgi:heme-degrading monooxygenase HmoA
MLGTSCSEGQQTIDGDREEGGMIARIWRGRATGANAEAYRRHFVSSVAPHLAALAGHRGAYLLRRESEGQVEFLAVTLWASLASVTAFAGPDPEVAIVEPEARAVLTEFDDFARHYEVAYCSD